MSPIGNYSLRWISSKERKEAASDLLCMATDLEMTRLSSLIRLPEYLDVQDFDVKVVSIRFVERWVEQSRHRFFLFLLMRRNSCAATFISC